MSTRLTETAAPDRELGPFRINFMRVGYLLMGLGLAVTKWPLLSDAHDLPLYESVTLCLLTAMSLLALFGLLRPLKLLPILLFETLWKILWLGLVALPQAATGGMDDSTAEVAINCSLVLIIIAVIPWGHVWRNYVHAKTSTGFGTAGEGR